MWEFVKDIITPCKDANTTIVSPENARLMCYTTLLFFFTAIYAIARGYYIYALMPATVLFSSLNYWRQPTIGWRRTLDIIIVYSFVVITAIVAFGTTHELLYFTIFFSGVLCYFLSYVFYKDNDHDRATFMHGVVHIFANLGLILLYSTQLPYPLIQDL
jgi:hypothetical protein